MDEYDYHQIDKAMSKKMDSFYGDPHQHKFYSEFDFDEAIDRRGRNGGVMRGKKMKCAHCGYKKKEHNN